MTRNSRVTYDELRRRDSSFVDDVDRWFSAQDGGKAPCRPRLFAPPPIFTPMSVRGVTLGNRIVVGPSFDHPARDGLPDQRSWARLYRAALGGAGLVLTDLLAVSADARVSPDCPGLYRPDHGAALARACERIHDHTGARVAAQLGHAGRRGATRPRAQGVDRPLCSGWPLLSASAIPYTPRAEVPREMTRADMDSVIESFVEAARRAAEACVDWLQIHAAQGYLLASFLSPRSNHRTDAYGGTLANRAAFPLEVLDAVRGVWPATKPLSVALSATDWAADGFTVDDAVLFAQLLKAHGCDVIQVHAGQSLPDVAPSYRPYFSTLFSDRIRNEAGIATLASGFLNTSDEVNSSLAAGRADLYRIDPRHLDDPREWPG
jgi:anthraniloyl-CoA monooxygenase